MCIFSLFSFSLSLPLFFYTCTLLFVSLSPLSYLFFLLLYHSLTPVISPCSLSQFLHAPMFFFLHLFSSFMYIILFFSSVTLSLQTPVFIYQLWRRVEVCYLCCYNYRLYSFCYLHSFLFKALFIFLNIIFFSSSCCSQNYFCLNLNLNILYTLSTC